MFSGTIVYNEESDLNGRSLRMEIIEQITAVLNILWIKEILI